jgi:hypothetical protein
MSSPAGAARYGEHSTGDRPVYARVLRLRHLSPGGVQCFVLFEGMIAVLLARLLGRRRGPRRPMAGPTGTGRAGQGSSGTGRAGAGPGGTGAAGSTRLGTDSSHLDGAGATGSTGARAGSAGTDPSEPGPNMRKAITRPRGRRGAIYGSPTGRLPAARSGEAPPPGGPAIGRATIPSRVGPGEAVLKRGRDAPAEPPADDENTTQGLTHSLNVLPAIETVDSPRQRARQSGARRYDD